MDEHSFQPEIRTEWRQSMRAVQSVIHKVISSRLAPQSAATVTQCSLLIPVSCGCTTEFILNLLHADRVTAYR